MALSKITYEDKETLNPLPSVADKNKVTNSNMNEIKSVVNSAIDQVEANTIPQQTTAPVSPSENDLWIDTDEVGASMTIDSQVSTSSTNAVQNQAITNYVNNLIKIETITIDAGSYSGVSEKYQQIYTISNIPAGYKFAGIVGYNMYGNNFTQCVVVQLHKYSDTQIEWGIRCWSSANTGPISLYADVLYIKE